MNRIQNLTEEQPLHNNQSQTEPQAEAGVFSPVTRDSTRVVFAPLHYESGYAYPLIVWLHGPGQSDERQLLRIMPVISVRNYVAVAPRGFPTTEDRSGGFSLDWPQSPGHIEESEQRIFTAIETASRKYHIARERVFLAGFDTGGTMAFRVAANHPGRFAGVVSFCGGFARSYRPLGRLAEVRRLPVFLAVGRDSTKYSPAKACDDLRLFHTAGISVALRQYPCGHELAPQMLRDLDRWIIEQITSRVDTPAASDDPWSCPSDS